MSGVRTTSSLTEEMVKAIDRSKASIALALEDFQIQKLSPIVKRRYRLDGEFMDRTGESPKQIAVHHPRRYYRFRAAKLWNTACELRTILQMELITADEVEYFLRQVENCLDVLTEYPPGNHHGKGFNERPCAAPKHSPGGSLHGDSKKRAYPVKPRAAIQQKLRGTVLRQGYEKASALSTKRAMLQPEWSGKLGYDPVTSRTCLLAFGPKVSGNAETNRSWRTAPLYYWHLGNTQFISVRLSGDRCFSLVPPARAGP